VASASQVDTAMDILLNQDVSTVSTSRASKKWVNPSIQESLDLEYVLDGTDDLLTYGQIYKEWKYRIIKRIHTMYTESKTDAEKLHWFMVMTTVTQRDSDLINVLLEPERQDRALSKELVKLMSEQDSVDMLFYIYDDEAKTKLWDLIALERKKIRDAQ
jgi:hypothetical protein